jgi:hypothetical protein
LQDTDPGNETAFELTSVPRTSWIRGGQSIEDERSEWMPSPKRVTCRSRVGRRGPLQHMF